MTKYLFPLLFAILGACAQLGGSPVDTFNKKVAAGYTTIQVISEGSTSALKSGVLKKTDAENVVVTMKASMQGLMVAQQLHLDACPLRPQVETPDPTCQAPAAEAKLAATTAILTALQAYLATQGVK